MDDSRQKILIIYTGGTIGMKENPDSHSLEPVNFEHLIENVPKIERLQFDIDNYQFPVPLDSSAINDTHWAEMAKVIEDNYDKYDGFVLLHGTDTMAYTASALSYMLRNLAKPVIITGSQLPIGEVRTDGEENLITALQVAADRDKDGSPMVQEVAILFENLLLRGNRSTKQSSDKFKAFDSNNYEPLAKIGLGITYNHDALLRVEPNSKFHVTYGMDNNVTYLDLFPGISENMVRRILTTPGLKGVVMKTFGAGNGPNDDWFLRAIDEAMKAGVIIINITQCSSGFVLPWRYQTGRELTDKGVVPGHDLTSEAAITKLMYLLGQGYTTEEVKKLMEVPLCGEISEG